jgi:MFS family permease
MSIGSIATGNDSMQRDLHASAIQIDAIISAYALGFAVTPLVTASFSEEFGRRPLYIATAFINFMMCTAMALYVRFKFVSKLTCILDHALDPRIFNLL